jgi:hypothetical protein|tara:strand:+ start:765 stop:1625 length:861 start_codon:yes stop_codon:yes gene_type:complete
MGANHVRKEVQRYLSEDVDRRVSFIQQELWIDYKTSEAVFRIMNNMSEVPLRPNAPALLVVGPGGSGKSAIISQIPHRVKNSKGLIVVSMAESPEIYIKKTLRSELSAALGLPSSQASGLKGAADIPNELREVIKLRRVWGLVIDEFHDALLRTKQEQRINMSILKKLLSAEYGLKLFIFGTMSAKLAMQSNEEFKRRFHEVMLGDWKEDEEFRSFLLELEESLPLRKPSCLYSEEMVSAILSITSGRMDKTVEIIRSAACYAIKTGVESINLDLLKKAVKNPWGY